MIVCGCGGETRIVKNSVDWLMKTETGQPYKLFSGDLWECRRCDHQMINLAPRAYIAKHEENFEWQLETARKSDYFFEEK